MAKKAVKWKVNAPNGQHVRIHGAGKFNQGAITEDAVLAEGYPSIFCPIKWADVEEAVLMEEPAPVLEVIDERHPVVTADVPSQLEPDILEETKPETPLETPPETSSEVKPKPKAKAKGKSKAKKKK